MGPIEKQWATGLTRRRALAALGGLFAGTPSVLRAQLDPRSSEKQVRTPSLDEMLEVFDFEPVAKDNVNRVAWNWTARGRDGEWSLRRNRIAFDWVELAERQSGTVESVDTRTELLGVEVSHPIFVCPSTAQVQMHPTGDAGMYQGVSATGGLYVVTGNTSSGYEGLLAAATGPRWNQIYIGDNLERNRPTLRNWLDTGGRAIVMTIDHTAAAYDSHQRIRWLGGNPPPPGDDDRPPPPPRASLTGPERYGVTPFPDRMWVSWDFVDRVRDMIPELPVMVKGIITTDDAQIALSRGYDAIIVSNHGARTMEYVPSPIEVLPEIAAVIGGRIPIFVDSGFRSGYDVFKALALGADGVGLGRAARWGLGAFGPAGVQRVFEIMERQLREAMVATGRPTIASIDATAVRTHFI